MFAGSVNCNIVSVLHLLGTQNLLHGADLSICSAGWKDQHQLHRDSTPRGTQMLPSGNTVTMFCMQL